MDKRDMMRRSFGEPGGFRARAFHMRGGGRRGGPDERPGEPRERGRHGEGPARPERGGWREGRGGPDGRHWGGRRGPGGPEGRPWGRGGGPRVGRGDVRAAVLSLLAEQPMHGYELIQQIIARSGGV